MEGPVEILAIEQRRISTMLRTSFLHASVIFIVLTFAHVEGKAQTAAQPKYGGSLKIGLRKDIVTLNPLADFRSTNGLVFGLVYESLAEVN